ncbi:MAG: AAA family ATPase [Deltaproteobacteria bacterium]|nr:AAA family ATPase [Deltaproteobacteria bacterium]
MSAPVTARQTADVFVGREGELARMRAVAGEAFAGRARLVLLRGEPGMGKTRTAEEVAAAARAAGARIIWGRCYEGEGAPAFWPWVQVIRACARDQALVRRALGADTGLLAHLDPGIFEADSHCPTESADNRFRLFDAVARLIRGVAERTALVLVFDDLQGADASSLQLLCFVARELQDVPVLIVATYRPVGAAPGTPLADALLELARVSGCVHLELTGLSAAEVSEYVRRVFVGPPSDALVASLHQRTEGNPFLLSEFVRALLSERGLDAADGADVTAIGVPENVRAFIQRRLRPLSRACLDTLQIAAVIGRDFLTDVVERATGATCAVVQEAVTARIVLRTASGRYRFAHALIRETLYEAIPDTSRRHLHRAVGNAIEQLPDAAERVAELAYHFAEADGDADGAKAVAYARRAGDRALALLAYEEAVRLYELADRVLHAATPGADEERCEVLLCLAHAQQRAGQRDRARDTHQRLAAIARRLGRPDFLARAAIADGHEGFAIGAKDEELLALLEEAFAALGDQESALRARTAAQLATALSADGGASRIRAGQLTVEAVALARRLGDAGALAEALLARHWVLGGSSNIEERAAVSTEAMAAAALTHDTNLIMLCRELRVRDLLELGEGDAFRREVEAQAGDAARIRQPVWLGQATHLRAVRAMLAGRLAECEQLAHEAFAIGQQVNREGAFQMLWLQLLQVCREQGRLAEVEPAFRAAADRHVRAVGFRSIFIYVLSELGRQVAARSEFERIAIDDFAAMKRGAKAASLTVALLAEVCAALGDAARAPTLYELLLPYAGRNIVTAYTFICFGSASHPLGLLAATMQRWDTAVQHFDDALAMYRRMGMPLFAARTQLAYARMLLARRQPDDAAQARTRLDAVLATARELGAGALEQQASELIASVVQSEALRLAGAAHTTGTAQVAAAHLKASATAVFRREGDYWTVSDNGAPLRLRDAKGLSYIAHLLRHPGREFHVLDLVTLGETSVTTTPASSVMDQGLPLLDQRARAEYAQRVADLRAELDEAEGHADTGRATRLRAEIEFLTEEIAGAVGLNGRNRLAAGHAERARSAVTKRIKEIINRIDEHNPHLGRYLRETIKTGLFCSYVPGPTRPMQWVL